MWNTDPLELSGLRRQMEIYRLALEQHGPTVPIAFEHLEQRAKEVLRPEVYDYVAGGAGSEETIRANRAAFQRWRIKPRMLRDVAVRDLSVELFGRTYRSPVLLAPVGVLFAIYPEGELAVARASSSLEMPLLVSTLGARTIEEIAAAMGDAPRWFQLYRPRSDAVTASLLHRAEAAGYSALVVTLDTFFLAWRERDLQHTYLPFLQGEGLANYFTDPVFCSMLAAPPGDDPARAIQLYGELYSSPSFTWESLAFLRANTRLPIVLKGILAPEDALTAVDHGVDGIIVSNHGGRQVDGAIAALDALPQVVEAVAGRAAVLFDSGIRRGADVIKALALGARAVLLGRPYCYGLAIAGEQGVREVALNLLADFDLTLALIGGTAASALGRSVLVEYEPRREPR
jgi:isopentenyl diphosphate isomerase/L-lactate dehydrogenase-like FMN-dependent dehydrogenase